MKVAYDISVLEMSRYLPNNRAGIFRVVENIAYGLADSQECDLFFWSNNLFVPIQNLSACLDYLESNLQLKEVPLPHSKSQIILYKKLSDLNIEIINTSSQLKRLFLKCLKKYVYYNIKTSEFYRRMIKGYPYLTDPKNLAEGDIFHSSVYAIPDQIKEVKSVKKFLTVYDLIPILYPQFFEINKDTSHFIKTVIESIDQQHYVTCISQATKDDLCNYINIDPSRVFVTHLAAEPDLFYPCSDFEQRESIRKKYQIANNPYILSLGTLEPRKNIVHVIKCFAKLVQEQNIKDLQLVLVGTKGWKYDNIFEEISNYDFLKERVILTGYVADEDLAALYSGALTFVYPSFYEGFGLPPLEAMQCGIPVITSNTSSLPEVVSDAGIMLDPTDTDGLCQSMLEIYNSVSLQKAMSLKSLERAKQFSWKKCVQETISAYQTSLSS